jgi:hypothetical protein
MKTQWLGVTVKRNGSEVMREINKREWLQFCRDITRLNQFGKTEVRQEEMNGENSVLSESAPLLGLELVRKGRKITSAAVTLGQANPNALAAPPIMLEQPEKITHEVAANGQDEIIEVQSKNGSRLALRVSPHTTEQDYGAFVSELAYSLSEMRGFAPGHDLDDWFTAERLIREAALSSE